MKKIISVIVVIAIIIMLGIHIGNKIISSPHSLTTQEVLQKFNWTLKSKTSNSTLGSVTFTKDKMIVKKNNRSLKNNYSVDSNDNLKIESGPYIGTYSMDMDSTDYSLSPKVKNNTGLKLIRN
ncbi:hypothetical protein FC19_GL000547 [Liquorilactobacillus aquaticus DSM 21051]|uniref:Uncharacterized protein n=1 Tax=Liquorilactobacillus aquaticus DSM 21051 TaxID=1423725 RepID=A0A0R2D6X1_9LACO|nr:hypothetical protein [Liquorilactobacillus aquaticus]KRM96267.1 hypothetical protein FC19_GL000547 [Liquorilactobacillus aquaticus DSM 21051]